MLGGRVECKRAGKSARLHTSSNRINGLHFEKKDGKDVCTKLQLGKKE